MTHLNLQPNQLTAFEKWALSKGYDIALSNEPNAEGSLDYRDPRTIAAYEGWLEGVLVGMKVRKRNNQL